MQQHTNINSNLHVRFAQIDERNGIFTYVRTPGSTSCLFDSCLKYEVSMAGRNFSNRCIAIDCSSNYGWVTCRLTKFIGTPFLWLMQRNCQ